MGIAINIECGALQLKCLLKNALIYPLVNATVFLRRQNSQKENEHNKHNDVYLREKVF